jgi:predicted transglutaminase-like cysteine proteinase
MFRGNDRRFARAARYIGASLLALGWVAPPAWGFQIDVQQLQQLATSQYGAKGAANVASWLTMLADAKGQAEVSQLGLVNQFWNRTVRKAEDMQVWGQMDYWATPLESLGKGAGDGEDYVIGKYYSLIAVGVSSRKLRFIYVRALGDGSETAETKAHMVLGYYTAANAVPLVLDNLVSDVSPASRRIDITPMFSFSPDGIDAQNVGAGPMGRLSRWRDLLSRMEKEGFALSP